LKLAGAVLLTGLALPLAAQAADEDLQKKIDQLSKEIELLKGQVKKVDDKSLGRWLTIGGDYRFRVDSLHGETAPYTNGAQFMKSLQQDPAVMGFFATPAARALLSTTSYAGVAGLTPNAMMGNLVNYMTNTAGNPYFGNPAAAAAYLQGIGGGAYAPAEKPKNESLYTNKFGLDLHAKATQNVTVTAKLDMYKTFGSQVDDQTTGNYFADRVGVFDGTVGHVPSDSKLNVDRVYATWSNIGDEPIWLSVGRRPATNGAPTNLKLNAERPGNGGTPALLVDYAFDGMTLGYAPDIESLPGAYAKICYGRGFDSGFRKAGNSVKDTDMLGIAVIPVDTDPLRVWLQWNRGTNIFDFPAMSNTGFGDTAPSVNLGSIDWYGLGAMSAIKRVGPGVLNIFADFGLSVTHPNDNVSAQAGFQGLLTGGFLSPEAPTDRTGWGAYAGFRYDLPSKTKIGFEYNHGSKNWIPFSPAADDMWTTKVGTRGNVFEPYIIQELNLKPISSFTSKAFFKIGYQYYDFEYTGSNNWVGAPQKISDLTGAELSLMSPVKKAHDIYATFEVKF
jgi:hypothetical protein